MAIVCLKLEALLCELLAKFCETQDADLALHYHKKYGNENSVGLFADATQENYSKILKNRCKMTLEQLIEEVFKPTHQNWGIPATHFRLSKHDNNLLDEVNKLSYKIVHYCEDTDESEILGHLSHQERIDIVSNYKKMIRESVIFTNVYPTNTEKVGQYTKTCSTLQKCS